MYLVIAGGGEVGSDLAKSLHTEHDVVVIDHSPDAAERLANYDVRVVIGNATDPEILREAGVERADAFIAATSIDEVNLISSLLAKGLGAREALCFVGRADYAEVLTDPRTMDILGTRIDKVLWPQRSLAQEILEIILIPKALDTEELAGGRLRLIEYLVEEGGPYAHRYLGDLEWPEGTLLLGVVRKGEFLSAREPDFAELVLEPGDHLIFVATRGSFPILHAYFAGTERVRKIMIVGGGAVGYMVARELERSGVELVLIEMDPKRAAWLSEQLSRTLVLEGDGTDLELLEAEGIEETDVLVAVTNNDEKNLLVSLLAKQVGVEKVITRVGRSENRPLFERVGIDIPLTPRQAAVREVIHHLAPGGVEHLAVIEDKVELIEVPVAEALAGKKIGELELPAKAVVVAVLRPRTVELARPELELRKGDRLLVLTPRELTEEVARVLGQTA